MKSLAEQMRNHDREQMSRMAHNLPEQYQECAPVEQVAQVTAYGRFFIVNFMSKLILITVTRWSMIWQRLRTFPVS